MTPNNLFLKKLICHSVLEGSGEAVNAAATQKDHLPQGFFPKPTEKEGDREGALLLFTLL